MFTLAYDDANNVWRLKLKERMALDYDDTDLGTDKTIRLTIQITDPEGNASATPRNVDISVHARVLGDAATPNLSQPQGTGAITENADGADSGITFTLTDPDTAISPTATDDTTDIDPNSFTITARDGTDAKFLDMFEFAQTDTADTWTLKLRDGMSLDYEDDDLDDDKILHFAVRVTDPHGNASSSWNIDISVENVDEIAPVIISNSHNLAAVTENELGADVGITLTVIDEITPGVRGELDSSNFHLFPSHTTHASYVDYFEFVREGTSDVWKMKLKDEFSLNHEGSGWPLTVLGFYAAYLDVRVIDDAGNVRPWTVAIIRTNNVHPETTPTLNTHLRNNVGTVTENDAAAYTGLRFTVTDDDTPISITGRTADITDIDPDSFTITAQDGTDDKFAKMLEVVREGTSNNWRIKLKDGAFLNYEDTDLPAPEDSGNKRISLAVKVTDPEGNTSTTWYFHIDVQDADDALPILSQAQGTGSITDNAAGADTGISFTLRDPDTTISTTPTADATDIDPNSFTITAAGGYPQRYADVFQVVWDDTAKNWKLKLRDGSWIDYEDPDLHDDKLLHFDIHVTDPDGNPSLVRNVDVEVENVFEGPHILPNVPGSLDFKSLTENQLGVDTGISFIVVSDNLANTPISYTVTDDTTDIDPSNITFVVRSGLHRFVLDRYEIVADTDGTNNWFKLKLKDGYAADYEGYGLNSGKTLLFEIRVHDSDGNIIARRNVDILLNNVEPEVTPTLFLTGKNGRITENVVGADSGASFTLSDPDTPISFTETADSNDIDPGDFTITEINGTDKKFAGMFRVARSGTSDRWSLQLKDRMSLDYDDPDLPSHKTIFLDVRVADPDKNQSSALNFNIQVRDAVAPVLGAPQGTGAIIENATDVDTGITFTFTDADTPISATATDDTTDIDPNSFDITARSGTDAKFADMFALAREGTSNTWKLKVKAGKSIDYEDPDLPMNKTIQLSVQITDPSGEASAIHNVDIAVMEDTTAPSLGAPQGIGAIIEDIAGANSGISFAVSDGMTLMTSPATTSTSDIDPDSFTITERASTNAKFAGLFTLAYDEIEGIWRLKLKERMSLDYGDTDLAADKTIRLTVQITDPEGNASATPRNVDIRVVDDAVAPNLSQPQGTGAISENVDGADSGITFTLTLTDPDTTISPTATDAITDIDPNSFAITARDGTDRKFAGMFTFAQTDTADTWTLKLKPGMSLDYEDTDLDADKMLHLAVRVIDPDGTPSRIRNIDIRVEDVDEIAPVISSTAHRRSGVMENELGAVTQTIFTVTDETAPGIKGVIDSSNFHFIRGHSTHRSYIDYVEFVREGTSDVWRLKLKDEFSLNYEGPGLVSTTSGTRAIFFEVSVIDDAGNMSAQRGVQININNAHPESTPTLNTHLRYNVGTVTENVQGVAGDIDAGSTGLRFTVTDDDTNISTTGRTADTTDIDPDSFTITAQDGTDDKFAKMFEVVREGTSNNWRIKLKDGESLDYEDPNLPAPEDSGNKRISFSVKLSDPEGNTSTTWYFHIDVQDVEETAPAPAPAPAPAITPDDLEDPAEDLGLTPIPDTDPNA